MVFTNTPLSQCCVGGQPMHECLRLIPTQRLIHTYVVGRNAYVRDVRVRLNTLFSHLQCIQPIHHNLSMDNEVKRPDATR